MLIVILIIGIIVCLIASYLIKDPDWEEIIGGAGMLAIAISIAAITLIVIFCPKNLDKKIAMYTEENQNIEIKVKETVRAYMKYEQDTYDNLVKDADITTLLIVYPDLNSNQLVKKEVDLYIENNKKIKELKEQKISRSTCNWWLYFGK